MKVTEQSSLYNDIENQSLATILHQINREDEKISKAVNNSYDVSKRYLEESKKTVKSDIILMNIGIDRVSNYFYSDSKKFKNISQY